MKKYSRKEVWAMSISVAEKMRQEGYEKSDVEDMDKFEMAKKFDERINNLPDLSMFDGKDYEDDDCFDYFKVLVLFQLARVKREN